MRDMAMQEHFEGPAIVNEQQQISLPGLENMLSPLSTEKGASETRVWGVKDHIERLDPGHISPPDHPFAWEAMYEAERQKIESLSN
jgi:hypothetical protein